MYSVSLLPWHLRREQPCESLVCHCLCCREGAWLSFTLLCAVQRLALSRAFFLMQCQWLICFHKGMFSLPHSIYNPAHLIECLLTPESVWKVKDIRSSWSLLLGEKFKLQSTTHTPRALCVFPGQWSAASELNRVFQPCSIVFEMQCRLQTKWICSMLEVGKDDEPDFTFNVWANPLFCAVTEFYPSLV